MSVDGAGLSPLTSSDGDRGMPDWSPDDRKIVFVGVANATGNNGGTPLHLAAQEGHVDLARMLLDKGAEVDARDAKGETPLHRATEKGHTDVAGLLLARGADVNATSKNGATALHWAASEGHRDVAQLLLDAGADVRAGSEDGWTPLNAAAWNGHHDVARSLLDAGADVRAGDEDDSTPLHSAARRGHQDVAQLLLDAGADLRAEDKGGWTPLHEAAHQSHKDVVALLLDRGADMDADDGEGTTPRKLQAWHGQEKQLREARTALRGKEKDTAKAKPLLLAIIDRPDAISPSSLCYAYVYLGYIEDRAGSREAAIAWFRKALEAETGRVTGIQKVAKSGLERPITWLRHLDKGTPPPPQKRQIGAGYVITEGAPPADLERAATLTREERIENFETLAEAIDQTYAMFGLKEIDWAEAVARYRPRIDAEQTADEFYFLLFQLVNELQDTHSWISGGKPPYFTHGPNIGVDLVAGKPIVVSVPEDSEAQEAGVVVGSEIVEIDGLTVEEKLEQVRPYLKAQPSERAFRRRAVRWILRGDEGTTVSLVAATPAGERVEVALKREHARPPAPLRMWREYPFDVTQQEFVHYGRHPSGVGYIRIRSLSGREEIADEFDRALKQLRDAPGVILDIRGNTGGFGAAQRRMVGRFIAERTLVAVSFRKIGPGHEDLGRQETHFDPSGEWQYRQPVALLVNVDTGSAADLLACYLRSARRVTTIGSTTHGNLSGFAAYIVLPCGVVARVSNAYVCDVDGVPIERYGNPPDIHVEPTVADFLAGRDPVLDKAVEVLRAKVAEEP